MSANPMTYCHCIAVNCSYAARLDALLQEVAREAGGDPHPWIVDALRNARHAFAELALEDIVLTAAELGDGGGWSAESVEAIRLIARSRSVRGGRDRGPGWWPRALSGETRERVARALATVVADPAVRRALAVYEGRV